jgi:hypothetical protein
MGQDTSPTSTPQDTLGPRNTDSTGMQHDTTGMNGMQHDSTGAMSDTTSTDSSSTKQ